MHGVLLNQSITMHIIQILSYAIVFDLYLTQEQPPHLINPLQYNTLLEDHIRCADFILFFLWCGPYNTIVSQKALFTRHLFSFVIFYKLGKIGVKGLQHQWVDPPLPDTARYLAVKSVVVEVDSSSLSARL